MDDLLRWRGVGDWWAGLSHRRLGGTGSSWGRRGFLGGWLEGRVLGWWSGLCHLRIDGKSVGQVLKN
jgi:hypothetical protein